MTPARPRPFQLFEVFGVELEYMIVGSDDLSVRPIADELLRALVGGYEAEVERGEISWSNELALHVFELKTTNPARTLAPLPELFAENVRHANRLLAPLGARLMPTAVHPWMDPTRELRLWPHAYYQVYQTFDRIFDCRTHGWANLQSVHINLPFAGDEQFGALHAAIRLLLPILPALAASSPVVEGRLAGECDARLAAYRAHTRRVPSLSGRIIPEPVFTRDQYQQTILEPAYRDIAPHDAAGILQHEWLNARGAIARFDRNAIEIRLIDMQECPRADLAIVAAVVAVVEHMVRQTWSRTSAQQEIPIDPLEKILLRTTRDADLAVIDDARYLSLLGLAATTRLTAGELWSYLLESVGLLKPEVSNPWRAPLRTILDCGPLARRIRRALGENFSPQQLHAVYAELCQCLTENRMFDAA